MKREEKNTLLRAKGKTAAKVWRWTFMISAIGMFFESLFNKETTIIEGLTGAVVLAFIFATALWLMVLLFGIAVVLTQQIDDKFLDD